MLTYIVLLLAGFCAGALNVVAGGGTFLSFPALVWVGVPPIAANATATFAALPGYVGSAWGFRKDMRSEGPLSVKIIIALAVLGGFLGALLLLVTSPDVFRVIVPWLLLLATAVFAAGPALLKMITARGAGGLGAGVAAILLLAIATYGGYFNGGLGIVLLALFSLWGMRDLNVMNGLKNGLSFILSAISVATFALAGIVAWPQAILMMAAATIGGYAGAPIARMLPRKVVRGVVIVVGVVMSAVFLGRLFI